MNPFDWFRVQTPGVYNWLLNNKVRSYFFQITGIADTLMSSLAISAILFMNALKVHKSSEAVECGTHLILSDVWLPHAFLRFWDDWDATDINWSLRDLFEWRPALVENSNWESSWIRGAFQYDRRKEEYTVFRHRKPRCEANALRAVVVWVVFASRTDVKSYNCHLAPHVMDSACQTWHDVSLVETMPSLNKQHFSSLVALMEAKWKHSFKPDGKLCWMGLPSGRRNLSNCFMKNSIKLYDIM